MKFDNIEVQWLGHAGFLVSTEKKKKIYLDPYNLTGQPPSADIIFLTHSHYDHCSIGDLQKIIDDDTIIVLPADAQSKITRFEKSLHIKIIEPGQELEFRDFRVIAVPAYNLHSSFHPKEEGWMGYVLKFGNVILYHAGDTDFIPEMQKLTGFGQENKLFIAMLPVGGRFTMNAEEAAGAAAVIKPNIAIPMHYGSVQGSIEDAHEFVKICEKKGVKAMILEKS
jgi:L-ascorbate metabolism protein UlaG (beta-lactamase superfamily)